MTTAAHTPGPWTETGFQIKCAENGFKVADVTGPDRRARGKEWKEDMDVCMANARLIAAAPELLAALVASRVSVQSNRDALYECHYAPHIGDVPLEDKPLIDAEDALLKSIDSAIAKATGAAP